MKDMPLFLLNRPFLLLKILRTEASFPISPGITAFIFSVYHLLKVSFFLLFGKKLRLSYREKAEETFLILILQLTFKAFIPIVQDPILQEASFHAFRKNPLAVNQNGFVLHHQNIFKKKVIIRRANPLLRTENQLQRFMKFLHRCFLLYYQFSQYLRNALPS